MLRDIGQSFLHYAVHGQIHTRWESDGLSVLVEIDRDTSSSHLREEAVEIAQTRCGRQVGSVRRITTEDAEDAPQLLESRTTGQLHGCQCLSSFFGLHVENVSPDAGLDRNDAEAVRHYVVEFSRDLQPLLGNRLLGPLDFPALLLFGLTGQACDVRASSSDAVADEPRCPDEDNIEGIPAGRSQQGRNAKRRARAQQGTER